jgi:histone-lysine N-methyltransferase SETMAR
MSTRTSDLSLRNGTASETTCVHIDNCSVHTRKGSAHWLEEHGMFHMPYPPYSPDLAPSDFYLFPIVKQKLESIQVIDDDELFDRSQELLAGIDQEELNRAFRTWVQ